ncbi:MAG: GMC family oxidoreductase [Phycisphaerales bacterium]|jgi:choline dehydrogenase-like flavoprotein
MIEQFDVIIVGTGAGGGTLARHLAPSGKRILILERGDVLPRERENWDTKAVHGDKRYLAKEVWYDKEDQPFAPYTHYWVGGNTKVYGAALLRLRESDFGEVNHFGGVSPAWPLSYAEFEPYYTRAEEMYSVHGDRGSDPCEPKSNSRFPFPSLTPEPRIKELYDDLKEVGYKPFPVPLGVRLQEREPGAAPYRFSQFDGYPDLTEVKADSHVVGIKHAATRPNVTLCPRAYVERLETDPGGRRVTAVHVVSDGEKYVFRADIVVLACGAINSAALLLRSANERHPRGLANSSDQVGRNYMCHQNGCFIAVSTEANPSPFQKYFGMTEFYHGPGNKSEPQLPLGVIQLMGKPDPWTLEWLKGDKLPGVSVEEIMPRTVDYFLTAEDLPSPENRITLRSDGAIRVTYTRNNTEAYDRLQAKLVEALDKVEAKRGRGKATYLAERLGVSGVSHQNGTLRFGRDAKTSVLDLHCKAHDLDNLYVVDGSFFPSSGAVNPSLTIMANALRVGDHLLRLLGAKEGE